MTREWTSAQGTSIVFPDQHPSPLPLVHHLYSFENKNYPFPIVGLNSLGGVAPFGAPGWAVTQFLATG